LKNLEALWVLRKLAGLIERDEQSSELIIERSRFFIGFSVADIRGAYLELNLSWTCVRCGTRVRSWKHPTQSSRFKLKTALKVAS